MNPSAPLRRIAAFSRPISWALYAGLAALLFLALAQAITVLLFFHIRANWYPVLSFSASGPALAAHWGTLPRDAAPLGSLNAAARFEAAALILLVAFMRAPILFNLARLFALYGRGEVFHATNAALLKRAGLWLIASTVMLELSDYLFSAALHVPRAAAPDLITPLLCGIMIAVIARVMELARDADMERKDFI